DSASALVATAELCPLGELDRARLVQLRAQIAFARRRGSDAPPLLLEAAERLAPLDVELAREADLDALGAAIFAGRLARPRSVETAGAGGRGGRGPPPPRVVDLLLDGVATRYTEGFTGGVEPLRRALGTVRADKAEVRWLWLACRIASELWEDETWDEL